MATVSLLFLLTASPGGGYCGTSPWSSGLEKPSSTSKLNAANKMDCNAKADTTKMAAFFFGNPDDNTGLIYFKSCRKSIEVMKYWHEARGRFPKNHDQFVFNEIKHELVSKFQVRIKFQNTAYISGFCQLGKDLNKVCTVHATCCIGLENKLYDLKNVIEDWKNYTSRPVWERQLGRIKWRNPGRCIH